MSSKNLPKEEVQRGAKLRAEIAERRRLDAEEALKVQRDLQNAEQEKHVDYVNFALRKKRKKQIRQRRQARRRLLRLIQEKRVAAR